MTLVEAGHALGRRSFLKGGAVVAGSLAVAGPLQALLTNGGTAARGAPPSFGPLLPAGPDLMLPPGFRYVAFGEAGQPLLGNPYPTPGNHDAMAAFPHGRYRGVYRLARNHENRGPGEPVGDPALAYDPNGSGGVTVVVFGSGYGGGIRGSWIGLNGTSTNCAGGPTPWRTWLSCEETTAGPETSDYAKPHGYVFEVPIDGGPGTFRAPGQPIKAMGRFVHEAAAVDPCTSIVYLTEDNTPSGFYRYIPNKPKQLRAGGELQMLKVKGEPGHSTFIGEVGQVLPVEWVTIDDPDPTDAPTNELAVAEQGLAKGAASFTRLEGAWYADRRVVFSSTDGGEATDGQVWEYRIDRSELVLLFQSPGPEVLDNPDNLTVSPHGGLILCEDGQDEQYLRFLSPDGHISPFARNTLRRPGAGGDQDFSGSEFAGATFSPDGKWLFCNVQTPGVSFAITGPWERYGRT